MSTQIQTLKGFRDFLPGDMLKRQWLIDRIREVFELWGYDPVETPTLEPLELFAGQIGEDEKLFFSFQDPGGRDVALRYDQTVPICRVVGQLGNNLPMPFRRYQIQPSFRAEKPQKGRYREFLQCDADIFGVDSPLADAEVIALSLDIYRKLGFKKAIARINDRKLLADLPYEAIVAMDKLEKIGRNGVIADMVKKGITRDNAIEYFDYVMGLKPNETVQMILDYLKAQGFNEDWYTFDPTIARSFSYSTGPIWEIVIPDSTGGSVLGGERFDKLVEKVSGKQIPGTGFGLGFDRTLEAAEEMGVLPENLVTNSEVLVTVFSEELLSASLEVATSLREEGINTELFPDPTKDVSKQLKYANRRGIPLVAIIGPDEANAGNVTLKNMATGDQQTVPVKDLPSALE